MIEQCDISERRACSLVGLSRTAIAIHPRPTQRDQDLSAQIVELAHVRRRFGYRRIHDLLRPRVPRREPQARVAAVQPEQPGGAQAPQGQARRSRAHAAAASPGASTRCGALDFVIDSLANGRRIKCLTVADDFSRECVDIAVDYGIGGQYVTRLLDQAASSAATPRPCAPTRAGVHQPGLHGLGA